MKPRETIIWTTKYLLRKAIKEAYLDYYGENISSICVDRIINRHEELKDGKK